MTTLTKVSKTKTLSLRKAADIASFSLVLGEYIQKNKLSCQIQGKQYVYCDGWKFAGLSFGLTAIAKKPENQSEGEEIKYACEADIVQMSTSKIISYGFAVCSNKESKKRSFDEYAIASMAQTRAIAKAYRNLLGFLMNSAGFESTPAEEMEEPKYSAGNKVIQEEVDDIKEKIEGIKSVEELTEYYNILEPKFQKSDAVKQLFTQHRLNLQK